MKFVLQYISTHELLNIYMLFGNLIYGVIGSYNWDF